MQQGWHPYTSIHVRAGVGGTAAEPRNVPVISSQLSGDERPRGFSSSSSTGIAEAQFEAVDMGEIYQRGDTHGCGIALAAFLAAGEKAPRIRFQPAGLHGSEAYQVFKEINEMCLQRNGVLVSNSEGLCIVAMTLLHSPGKYARELWGYVLPPGWLRDVARRMKNRQYCLVLEVNETLGNAPVEVTAAAAAAYSPRARVTRADGAVRVGLAYNVPAPGQTTHYTRQNTPGKELRKQHDFWIRPGVEGLDPVKFDLYVNSRSGTRPYINAALQAMNLLGSIPEDRIVARDPDDPAFAAADPNNLPLKTLEALHLAVRGESTDRQHRAVVHA